MRIRLGDVQTIELAGKAMALSRQAADLMGFVDREPELSGECGIEVNAVEARALLSGDLAERLSGLRGTVEVEESDLERLSRLEGVLALASSRIGARIRALDEAEGSALATKLGSMIGLATGAVGLVKSLW
jgi:hypothetical protein